MHNTCHPESYYIYIIIFWHFHNNFINEIRDNCSSCGTSIREIVMKSISIRLILSVLNITGCVLSRQILMTDSDFSTSAETTNTITTNEMANIQYRASSFQYENSPCHLHLSWLFYYVFLPVSLLILRIQTELTLQILILSEDIEYVYF